MKMTVFWNFPTHSPKEKAAFSDCRALHLNLAMSINGLSGNLLRKKA